MPDHLPPAAAVYHVGARDCELCKESGVRKRSKPEEHCYVSTHSNKQHLNQSVGSGKKMEANAQFFFFFSEKAKV